MPPSRTTPGRIDRQQQHQDIVSKPKDIKYPRKIGGWKCPDKLVDESGSTDPCPKSYGLLVAYLRHRIRNHLLPDGDAPEDAEISDSITEYDQQSEANASSPLSSPPASRPSSPAMVAPARQTIASASSAPVHIPSPIPSPVQDFGDLPPSPMYPSSGPAYGFEMNPQEHVLHRGTANTFVQNNRTDLAHHAGFVHGFGNGEAQYSNLPPASGPSRRQPRAYTKSHRRDILNTTPFVPSMSHPDFPRGSFLPQQPHYFLEPATAPGTKYLPAAYLLSQVPPTKPRSRRSEMQPQVQAQTEFIMYDPHNPNQ